MAAAKQERHECHRPYQHKQYIGFHTPSLFLPDRASISISFVCPKAAAKGGGDEERHEISSPGQLKQCVRRFHTSSSVALDRGHVSLFFLAKAATGEDSCERFGVRTAP